MVFLRFLRTFGPRRWRRVLMMAVLLLVALMLGGCSSLTSLFFVPQTVWIRTPIELGLDYEDVWLNTVDDVQVHGWWIPAQRPQLREDGLDVWGQEPQPEQDTVVLYLHGNGENISSHIASVGWLASSGIGLLALDYRGYGASAGQAMVPAVFADIEAAAHWLRQRFPDKRLVVLGQSLGAALAVPFVAKAQDAYGIDALVLEAPFSGYGTIAREALSHSWLGWLLWPFTWLLPGQWDPLRHAGDIHVPVLVMHSRDDGLIPPEQGRAVFGQLHGTDCWLWLQGPHVAGFASTEVRDQARSFILSNACQTFTRQGLLDTMPRLSFSGVAVQG